METPKYLNSSFYDPPACARLIPLHAMPILSPEMIQMISQPTIKLSPSPRASMEPPQIKIKKLTRKKRLAQRTTLASEAKNSRINSLDENNIEEQSLREASAQFKDRRLELDYSQVDVAKSIAGVLSSDISQTTISRYETFTLSTRNMRKIKPMLDAWLDKAIEAINSGMTPAEFLAQSKAVAAASTTLLEVAANDQNMHNSSSSVDEYFFYASKPTEAHPYIGRRRRSRTMLTPEQRVILQEYFALDRTPCENTMRKLSEDTSLELNVIKTWFANSRQAARKKNQLDTPTPSSSSNNSGGSEINEQQDECSDVIKFWTEIVSNN